MLSEKYKIVPMFSGYSLATHDTLMTSDSINMANYHKATFLVQFDDLGTAATILYLYSGATDAALTTAMTFTYAWASGVCGAASADVLAAWATSAALTIPIANDNMLLVIEVDTAEMTAGHDWLTFNFTDPVTGATGQVTITAILTPRYSGNVSITALA